MYEIEYWRFISVQNLTKTLNAGFPLIVTHLYVNIGDQKQILSECMHCVIFKCILGRRTSPLLLAAKQPLEAFRSKVLRSSAPQQSLLRLTKLPCVFMCVCSQKHFSGEVLCNTKSSHVMVVSDNFLSSGDTCIIMLCAHLVGPPLKATDVLRADCEIYCTERYGAKWDSHLKDNCSKDSLLLRREPKIPRGCQNAFSFSRKFGTLWTFSGPSQHAHLTHF